MTLRSARWLLRSRTGHSQNSLRAPAGPDSKLRGLLPLRVHCHDLQADHGQSSNAQRPREGLVHLLPPFCGSRRVTGQVTPVAIRHPARRGARRDFAPPKCRHPGSEGLRVSAPAGRRPVGWVPRFPSQEGAELVDLGGRVHRDGPSRKIRGRHRALRRRFRARASAPRAGPPTPGGHHRRPQLRPPLRPA